MNKNKLFILFLTVFCAFGLTAFEVYENLNNIMGIGIISQHKAEEIMARRTEENLPVDLYFDNVLVPYAVEENSFYISQSMNSKGWQGALTKNTAAAVKIIRPEVEKLRLMASGTPLKLLVYTSDGYTVKNIAVSGLPVISIFGEQDRGEEIFGTMNVFDSNSGGRENVTSAKSYKMRFHVRGGTSKAYPKKNYKVNLLDKNGNSKSEELLGMRKDNDWILNAMYTDDSKMREKIGYDLWDNLSDKYNHSMNYCEVIIDNNYRGLYCLQEPVDNKTFGADKNRSMLVSLKGYHEHLTTMIINGEYASDRGSVMDMILADGDVNGEIEATDFPAGKAEDMLEFVKFVVLDRCGGADRGFTLDKDSAFNHELLINLICARDNDYKNEKLMAVKKDGEYIVYKTPWDLDLSMQCQYISVWTDDEIPAETDQIVYDGLLPDYDDKDRIMEEKYRRARENFYNEEYIFPLIDSYYNQLAGSGAYSRDNRRWGATTGQSPEQAAEFIKEFYGYRFPLMDEFYNYRQK